MQKFKLTPAGFADLLKQLFENKLITETDLAKRGIQFKVVRKQPAPVQAVVQPVTSPKPTHLPADEDEGFLDTETLTDLLAFKTPEAAESKPKPPPEPPPEEKDESTPLQKKSRFSFSGLFKKDS